MRILRGLGELPAETGGTVVSVGVFDGVHRGHRAILAANEARAAELGLASAVVTFEQHPKKLLLGNAPRILTTLEHRLELFERAGMALALVLAFDQELRSLSAEEFVDRILIAGLDARAFVLGFDSKFGRDRQGTPKLLQQLGHDVRVVPKVVIGGRAVSSTAIREAVELGDLEMAERMLGRPVSVLGEVVHGRALGRRLGFPTANLDLHDQLHPPVGVYACLVQRPPAAGSAEGNNAPAPTSVSPGMPAVANIGFRPTVEGHPAERPTVEVHLLDFEEDLYGQTLELVFVARLRGEQRFADVEALRAQIGADVSRAREILATT